MIFVILDRGPPNFRSEGVHLISDLNDIYHIPDLRYFGVHRFCDDLLSSFILPEHVNRSIVFIYAAMLNVLCERTSLQFVLSWRYTHLDWEFVNLPARYRHGLTSIHIDNSGVKL